MGLREKLLARRELRSERVDVPGLDEPVFVRQLSPREMDDYHASQFKVGKRGKVDLNKDNLRARLLVVAVVDAAGKQVFEERDVDALGEVSPDVVEALYAVAARLNHLDRGDDEEPELKNGRASASPTGSPSASAGPAATDSSTS